ncbi:Ribosomal RNA processing protein 1-like B [Stylophora pistillata]|uniref:Ribosomal RNA processing protein 1-like B n=2 Tax=Stylophora pistillata TaxID=50429 RepID=A0A2B4SUJ7_STYPI|nr:Ribosomal RNA processing protein 1-like B [Stylophora pistillata]
MWMSDKPLIQEELALNISQLIFSFRNEQSAVFFIKAFFKTMQREWHGIDRLRLDKFYMLLRFFVKETFNFLKKTGWEERLVCDVVHILNEEPMNPISLKVPDGIRLHMVSVYLPELTSVLDDEASASAVLKLLDPLFLFATHSSNKTVTSAVGKSLFEHLVQQQTGDSEEQQNSKIKVDFASAADRLFSLASDRNILGRNRNQLFNWAKRLRKGSTEGEHVETPVQEDRIPNGFPVGSKRKTEERESLDNHRDHSHTKKPKQKNKKIKVTTDKKEEELDKHSNEYAMIDDKKEGKRKRKNGQDSEGHVELSFEEEEEIHTQQNTEPKNTRKKKKKSLLENDKRTVFRETETNSFNENGEELVNDTSDDTTSAVNGDTIHSTDKNDQTSSRTVKKKVLHEANGHGEEPFAKFQKNSTPPAFVRRFSAKIPSTERRKKTNMKFQLPGSEPSKGTQKRVRIEMSKNTSHTTQDYKRSLKESPSIPFDAGKTPPQGLLKSPPKLQRTPVVINKTAEASTGSGQLQQKKKQPKIAKRPKALDFF